jgi:hypothetical protein
MTLFSLAQKWRLYICYPGYKVLLHEIDPKSAALGTCKEAETDSRAKFGKEIVAGARREAKMGPIL